MSKPVAASVPPVEKGPGYDEDICGWAIAQAAHLRAGRLALLDLDNLAEEIESLGRGEFNSLVSTLTIVLQHMLTWDHQPERRSRSWALSISEHRRRVNRILRDNPSLRPRWREAVGDAYVDAVGRAADETGLRVAAFPAACPYSDSEIHQRPFPVDPD